MTTKKNLSTNSEVVSILEPAAVWQAFARISDIPRASKNEAAILSWIANQAKLYGHETLSDSTGNLLVRLKADSDKAQNEGIILQAHVDMVCEKNTGTIHDFEKDPLQLVVDGEWLRAHNTTLGADNGIAVAMMVALMGIKSRRGPVDLLFTIDEETGLTGAMNLDPSMLNFKRLINLDGEEEGSFYIGCAGGKETVGTFPLQYQAVKNGYKVALICVKGLQGGHSGADIHKEPGNAIKLLARLLYTDSLFAGVDIVDFYGGDKHNAVPREAFCIVSFDSNQKAALENSIEIWQATYRKEFGSSEPGIALVLQDNPVSLSAESIHRVWAEASKKALIRALYSTPHGVLSMSRTIPGLVSTSTNLAAVKTENNILKILTSQRSDIQSRIEDAAHLVGAVLTSNGFAVDFSLAYPSWTPQPDSSLLALTKQEYLRCFPGKTVFVGAIHAGLECGVIGARKAGMDMVSFGPTITGAHTPQERAEIGSVARTWQFLLSLLEGI